MSEENEMEKLRVRRIELEAESRTLKEMHKRMETRISILEEKINVDELETNNKVMRDAIIQLESKIKTLESRLKKSPQEPTVSAPEKEPPAASANPAPSEKSEETPETVEASSEVEAPSEDFQLDSIIVEAIDQESLVENQEDLKKQEEKKKRRFF